MKKLFSALLSLALCAGLTVQAFAAGPLAESALAALLAHINWGLTCNHACARSVVCHSEALPAAGGSYTVDYALDQVCPQHGEGCGGYHHLKAYVEVYTPDCPQHGGGCGGYHTGSQGGGHHGGGHHGRCH